MIKFVQFHYASFRINPTMVVAVAVEASVMSIQSSPQFWFFNLFLNQKSIKHFYIIMLHLNEYHNLKGKITTFFSFFSILCLILWPCKRLKNYVFYHGKLPSPSWNGWLTTSMKMITDNSISNVLKHEKGWNQSRKQC